MDLFQLAAARRPLTVEEARFLTFDAEHPEVWRLFVDFSFQVIEDGFDHYSADAVLHRVRWETRAGALHGLKINNNFAAFYSRKFSIHYPQHSGFFRKRRSQADAEVAA